MSTTLARLMSHLRFIAVVIVGLCVALAGAVMAPAQAQADPTTTASGPVKVPVTDGVTANFDSTCVLVGAGWVTASVANDGVKDLVVEASIDGGGVLKTWDTPAGQAIGNSFGPYGLGAHEAVLHITPTDGGPTMTVRYQFVGQKCEGPSPYQFGLDFLDSTPSTIKGNVGDGSATLLLSSGDEIGADPVTYTIFATANPAGAQKVTVQPGNNGRGHKVMLFGLGYTGENLTVHVQFTDKAGKDRDEVFTFDPIRYQAPDEDTTPVKAVLNCPERVKVSGYKAGTIRCSVTNKSGIDESYSIRQTGARTASYSVKDVKPGATVYFGAKVTVGKQRLSVTNGAGTSYDDIAAYWPAPDAWVKSVSKGTFCVHTDWPAPNKIYWEDGKLKKGKWRYGKNHYLTRKGGDGTYCGNGPNVKKGKQNKLRVTVKSGGKKDQEVLNFDRRPHS